MSTHFTPQQWRTLEAAVNRIIPADDYPSGWESGVGDYLDRQFSGDLAPYLETYRTGLDALDSQARLWGEAFADSKPDVQDSILRLAEFGTVQPPWPINARLFFQLLVQHSMEGFYADPGNGGNRDCVSWRMVGFEVTA